MIIMTELYLSLKGYKANDFVVISAGRNIEINHWKLHNEDNEKNGGLETCWVKILESDA